MRNSFRPALETLESREVPAASLAASGILTVRGTAAADHMVLQEDPASNTTIVLVNGVQQNFLSSRITRIDVFGYAGNDVIDASGIISDVVREFGGNGNDRLVGGGQNDWLYGEYHNDVLIGGPGNDYESGGYGIDVFYRGGFDRPLADIGARSILLDVSDGPALVLPVVYLIPGAPERDIHATGAFGERDALSFLVYSPAYSPVTVHSVRVAGNFVGGTGLRMTISDPNHTDDAGIPVQTRVTVNADGSRTIFFLTPVTLPARSAVQFQVRFLLGGPVQRPFDIDLRSVGVVGPAPNLQWRADFDWNV